MSVRAKVRVETVEPFDCYAEDGTPQKGASITMRPVYDNAPENKSWSQATPSGQFQMSITNPPAAAFFQQGAELFVDFTPATDDPNLAKALAEGSNDDGTFPGWG